jgi:class 3 adenylate cyclase/tetratricopeptide (TPR) repeat protein
VGGSSESLETGPKKLQKIAENTAIVPGMVLHRLGPFRLDTQDDLLLRGSEPVALGRRAIAVLRVLLERPGAVVSKDALITAGWHHQAVEESNLTVQIAALRRALGETHGGDSWIETIPRRGYRFIGPVVREEPDEAIGRPPPVDATPSVPSMSHDDAERRQVTAMFCELIGHPRRANTNDDLEDWREAVDAFRRCVSTTADRHEGFIAGRVGNAVFVLFGYPAAHEHDAEQAVRAGLELCAAVRTLERLAEMPLRCRVGISTGMVIVGNFIGFAERRNLEIVGDTPELAARLQMSAEPDTVVVERVTRHLLGNLFECRDLDPITIGCDAQPIRRWQVRGESVGVSRFEARRAAALSPFVGRQDEIELLLRRWDQTKLGEGRVVLLSGEPGIGKSRIGESLLARLDDEPHARLRYFCSPHHTHSPLYPFITQLNRAAGFEPGSDSGAKLDRLEALLEPTTKNVSRDVALIAELLAVPADERYPALAVGPQEKREMTLRALLEQLDGAAAQSPVLIVFEDVHWIDPTSLDLLDRTVTRVADLPVLLVMTFRPEFQPTWIGQPHVTMLPLSRLGRRDSAAIIAGLTRDKDLPDAIVEQVLAHTDGVPLFIEELTSTLLESGLLRETADSYVLDGPLPPLAIPTTLQASLLARLDRLGTGKDAALIGAAIGREFSHELIAAVSAMAPMDLEAALERLTASGLISRRGTPPDASYAFKHALVRDAAYVTMVKTRRRQLHASIAKVLIEQFRALAESLPQVVAEHYTEAGLASEALDNWVKAGRLALARSANREAVTCFEQALQLLKALPETRETLQLAIDLRLDLKPALFRLGEFKRIIDYLREGEGLARTLDDQRRLGQLYVDLCHTTGLGAHPAEAIVFGQSARAIAESLEGVPLRVMANLYLAGAYLRTGDYPQAEDLLLKVLQLLEGPEFVLTEYPAATAHSYLARIFTDRGKFEQGTAHGRKGLRLAEARQHFASVADLCWQLAYVHFARGEIRDAISLLERGLALSREWKLSYFAVLHSGGLGYAYALSGRIAEGIPLLERAVSAFGIMGNRFAQGGFTAYLAEVYLLANRLEDALEFAGRALTLAREWGLRPGEAKARWLLGEVTARRDPPEHAEGHYRDALTLAESCGMRPLGAHCHLGLGKLCRRTGAREQAQEHVAAAVTMYRDMGMDHWLVQAEAEMRQLQ